MPSTPLPRLPLSLIEANQLRLIEANRREYGLQYNLLTFADSDRLAAANAERRELLEWLEQHASFGYAGTKVDCTSLSPGCRRCGDGGWSCLFVNGRCNGQCRQAHHRTGWPVSNGLRADWPTISNSSERLRAAAPFLLFGKATVYSFNSARHRQERPDT